MKHFALAGNPNCGKTTLFNSLTGSTARVGNWPGVTVDKREGVYKKTSEPVNIVDLPGIYSLSPYTPEEIVSRDFVLNEKPDCVINVVDVTNLERNLYLTTQLLEIDVPVVVALNMMDVLKEHNETIDAKMLEKKLGVPVVEISALRNDNLDVLMERAYEVSLKGRSASTILKDSNISDLIDTIKNAYQDKFITNSLFHAIKLIEKDEVEIKGHEDLVDIVDKYIDKFEDKVFGRDFEALIADARYKYISKNLVSKTKIDSKKLGLTKSDKVDKVLTNRFLGIPIFLLILFFIFHLTFSANFLYLGGLFADSAPSFEGSIFEGLLWTSDGINSPGVILQSFVINVTDWLSGLAGDALANASPWVSGLLVDGVLGGLFSLFSFIPQILLLFLLFSILEDTGYMSRVAFILDRIFRRFGLSGRAFMPMIMGFGCSIPAMINTRTLQDERERTATIRVIPFFSCGAKLPILTAIAGAIISMTAIGNADIITYSMYLLGIVTAIVSIIFMRQTSLKGEVSPFIMELPAYRSPKASVLMIHLWDKLKHFVKKAFTIILASTIVIWFISHFSWGFAFLEDEQMGESILASIGKFLLPLFTPMGFGSQLNAGSGWVFPVGAITGLIAKENVIATFGTLGASLAGQMIDVDADGGIAAVSAMIHGTGITVPALIAFIAFNMTTIPCFAAVASAKSELPKGKYLSTLAFWVLTSYLVSTMVYTIGSWAWTSALWIVAIALVIAFIVYKNKKEAKNKSL